MINEWEEFKAYTEPPKYAASGKNDRSYLGRFTFEMFFDCVGLTRVLTILARGYLFHNSDGTLRHGNPRDRHETVYRALCAWCSIPSEGKSAPQNQWEFESDFSGLHAEFPELVNEYGCGWYYRHVYGVIEFIELHPDSVTTAVLASCQELKKGFTAAWRKKVVQYQFPLFDPKTKAQWGLTFTEALASALEEGPLRQNTIELPLLLLERLEALRPEKISRKLNVIQTLVAYYIANRQEGTDWVVLPVVNFDAYFHTASFGKKYLTLIPPEVIERDLSNSGVCRYRVLPEYLPETFQSSGA